MSGAVPPSIVTLTLHESRGGVGHRHRVNALDQSRRGPVEMAIKLQ